MARLRGAWKAATAENIEIITMPLRGARKARADENKENRARESIEGKCMFGCRRAMPLASRLSLGPKLLPANSKPRIVPQECLLPRNLDIVLPLNPSVQ